MIVVTIVAAAGNDVLADAASLHRENDVSHLLALLPIFEFAPDG